LGQSIFTDKEMERSDRKLQVGNDKGSEYWTIVLLPLLLVFHLTGIDYAAS